MWKKRKRFEERKDTLPETKVSLKIGFETIQGKDFKEPFVVFHLSIFNFNAYVFLDIKQYTLKEFIDCIELFRGRFTFILANRLQSVAKRLYSFRSLFFESSYIENSSQIRKPNVTQSLYK